MKFFMQFLTVGFLDTFIFQIKPY